MKISGKRFSDIRLQDEIKLFTTLIITVVLIFQMLIFWYFSISSKNQKQYIKESINVMMNDTVSGELKNLEKFQQTLANNRCVPDFIKNPHDPKNLFETQNAVNSFQQMSNSILHSTVFDTSGNQYGISANISDAKFAEIQRLYTEYIESKTLRSNFFFIIPDSMYREIYFLSFSDVRENIYDTASTRSVGTLAVFSQISTDTLLYDYSVAKNSKFYLHQGDSKILIFDHGNTENNTFEIKNIKIRNTDWYITGCVNYSTLIPNTKQVIILIIFETLLTLLSIYVFMKCIKFRMVDPFNITKKYIEELSISQLFTPLDVKGNKDITEFATNINNMVIRNKKLANSVLMKQQKLYEAERLRDAATLYALQNQVNPHYMYNIFELIRSLAVVDGNEQIESIATSVSKIFRYNLKNDTIVTIEDEYNIIKTYIDIMYVKYGEAFDVKYNIPEELYSTPVMKMLFQPIVENSFNHGFVRQKDKFTLNIAAYKDDNNLCFIFKDNGLGIPQEKLDEIKKSFNQRIADGEKQIGLANLNRRLDMCYGSGKYNFEIESEINKYTQITIKINI